MNRVFIFRGFAREATKNSHAAIKACWAILFTGGTFALLHSFDDLIDCRFSLGQVQRLNQDPFCREIQTDWYYFFLSVLLFVVYLLTFYRFYVGNIRVFDMIYDEVFKFIDSLHLTSNNGAREDQDYQNLLDYSDNLIKWESLFLILTTLIIVYLTVTPLNAAKFIFTYFILLVTDIIWLSLLWLFGAHTVTNVREYIRSRFFANFPELTNVGFDGMFPSNAMRAWKLNNLVFTILIGAILMAFEFAHYAYCILPAWTNQEKELLLLWFGGLAAFANCLVDLKLTWRFYNPKFGNAHRILIGSKSDVSS